MPYRRGLLLILVSRLTRASLDKIGQWFHAFYIILTLLLGTGGGYTLSEMNGIDALTKLCHDENGLIRHIVCNILFPNPEDVEKQNQCILQKIKNEEAIKVRYTSNKHFIHRYETRTEKTRFKNKKAARCDDKEVFHSETGLKVCFDSDGNTAPRQVIYDCTNHWVSFGTKSTLLNYTIAHIWGKTHDPLFFSSLWNYCVIPSPFACLTDRRSDANKIEQKLQDLIKGISVELYNPRLFLEPLNARIDMPSQEAMKYAESLIQDNKIKFIPINKI